MKFDSQSGSKGGKISKRGSAIGVELRGSLYELVDKIINELDYESLNASQKIKLLDVALKYSLPRLSIEKSIEQIEEPRKFEITVIDDNGNSETHSTLLDENFTLKKAFGCE